MIAKTPDGGTITAGQTATFTIVVTNNGPGTANSVTHQRSAAGGRRRDLATATPAASITGSGASQTLSCTLATLAQAAAFTAVAAAVTSVGATTVRG